VINVPVAGQQLKVRIPSGSRQGSRLKLRGSGPGGSDLVLILES
jgi:DnaJ-class molecular chaperone